MKPSHLRTPRTLDECGLGGGFLLPETPSIGEKIADVLLATVVGIVVAMMLVHWWAS